MTVAKLRKVLAKILDRLEVRLVADGDMAVWYRCRRVEIHGFGEPESDVDKCLLLISEHGDDE